jgi:hypothetical protein
MTDKPNADRLPSTMMAAPPGGRSYGDLVRKLVPLPDSSHRPTHGEEREAEVPREPRVASSGGAELDTVRAALHGLAGVDVADVQVDVAGTTATVTGSVARGYDRDRVVSALHAAPGVVEVIDHLRIRLA